MVLIGCGNGEKRGQQEAYSSTSEENSSAASSETKQISDSTREQIEGLLYGDEKTSEPKIAIAPPYSLVQILDVNLDLDRNDEQILVVKAGDSPDSPIKIIIADYDTLRDGYYPAWESETGATQRRFFGVTLSDVVGDHNTEIICSGIDSQGKQTLDIFRRESRANNMAISYEPIITIAVEGTIEIRESERSQAYLNGLKNGDSFPVFATVENENETVRSMYAWRSGDGYYIKVNEEKTPREEIEDRKLRELFNSGVDAFEEFLSRNWNGDHNSTILFDKSSQEITLYSGDIQEIYHWNSSYRFLSNSISIKGENELVPYIRVEISIRILDSGSIRVSLYDIDNQTWRKSLNDSWSGTYYAVPKGTSPEKRGTPEAPVKLPTLSGFYRGESGEELILTPPRFTLSANGEQLSGGFAVYMLNVPVFELKIIDDRGIGRGEQAYRLVYKEEQDNDKITRTLGLIPGIIGMKGFIETDDPEMRFRQIEYFEDDQSQ